MSVFAFLSLSVLVAETLVVMYVSLSVVSFQWLYGVVAIRDLINLLVSYSTLPCSFHSFSILSRCYRFYR